MVTSHKVVCSKAGEVKDCDDCSHSLPHKCVEKECRPQRCASLSWSPLVIDSVVVECLPEEEVQEKKEMEEQPKLNVSAITRDIAEEIRDKYLFSTRLKDFILDCVCHSIAANALVCKKELELRLDDFAPREEDIVFILGTLVSRGFEVLWSDASGTVTIRW